MTLAQAAVVKTNDIDASAIAANIPARIAASPMFEKSNARNDI